MFTKFAAGVVLTGALALGSVGVAAAATPSTSGSPAAKVSVSAKLRQLHRAEYLVKHPQAFNCANEAKAEAKITKAEARITAGLPKLVAAEKKAEANGHTKLAARIQKAITKAENPSTTQALQKLQAEITAKCAPSTSTAG
jgi:hypothetical protein